MQTIYPFFLTIHLLCAVIFVGFLFTDVVLLGILKRQLGENALEIMMRRGRKIMPLCVLLLVLTGGAMMTRYLSFESFFDSNLQKLLVIKIALALTIVCLVLNALTHKIVLQKPNPLGAYTHKIALTLGFFIIILAKFAFFV